MDVQLTDSETEEVNTRAQAVEEPRETFAAFLVRRNKGKDLPPVRRI